jgi:hypothetical protein
VAGGSIGGLCAGIALRGIGCEVELYERAPGAMASRGAVIVVQDDLVRLLRRHGSPELPTVSCLQRHYLLPQGGDGIVTAMPQRFTSWHAIYLRICGPCKVKDRACAGSPMIMAHRARTFLGGTVGIACGDAQSTAVPSAGPQQLLWQRTIGPSEQRTWWRPLRGPVRPPVFSGPGLY